MEVYDIEVLICVVFFKVSILIMDLVGDGNYYVVEVIDESFCGMNCVQQ